MSELPKGWERTSLLNLVVVNYGKALPEQVRNAEGGFPVFGSSGAVGKHDAAITAGPAVIVGRKGAAGSVHLVDRPCWPIDTAYFIEPPAGLSIRWLYYFLGSQQLVRLDKSTAIPSLSRDDLYNELVPVAPELEQERVLGKLEELITDLEAGEAELRAAQKKLTQFRQSLLKAAVEGAVTAPWREQQRAQQPPAESGAQLLQRILTERRARWESKHIAKFEAQGKAPPKDWQKKYPEPVQPDTTDLPALPQGWVWASLDMLGEIASGVAKGTKREEKTPVREVPYLRVANVQRGYLDLSEVKTILATERDIEDLALQNGDVLFNEGGDRDKLGRGWVWRNEVPECIHQNHVFRMRPFLTEMNPEFISHHGNTFGKLWFQNAGKQTTNLASINMTMLRAFPVPVAPPQEQVEIVEQIEQQLEALGRQENATELGLKQALAQRQNILRAAFSGQLVPQDPSDEPAAYLLARIRAERTAQAPARKPRGRRAQEAA